MSAVRVGWVVAVQQSYQKGVKPVDVLWILQVAAYPPSLVLVIYTLGEGVSCPMDDARNCSSKIQEVGTVDGLCCCSAFAGLMMAIQQITY